MSISEFLSLACGVGGGNIDKKEVQSALDQYEKFRACSGENDEEKKSSYGDVVSKFYDLTACIYELCWGDSIHLAHRYKGETLRESLKRHEHFLALQLALKPGMKVLDVGCGVGGPLREISRFSKTSITGLNNNDYQIKRGRELNRLAGINDSCNYVKADFMKMPFPDNTFDAIYAIESTCYAADWLGCFKEIYRVLKPGQFFAAYEWCLTDSYDPKNETHEKIKKEICVGTSAPDIRFKRQCLETLENAGFEVIWDKDLAEDSPIPFYKTVDTSTLSLNNFLSTGIGRYLARMLLKSLEYVRLAPVGTVEVGSLLESGIEAQAEGGRHGIFSPMYFVLVRKPHQDS